MPFKVKTKDINTYYEKTVFSEHLAAGRAIKSGIFCISFDVVHHVHHGKNLLG